jgi:transcriptional regulator with XRE-family HTH domain
LSRRKAGLEQGSHRARKTEHMSRKVKNHRPIWRRIESAIALTQAELARALGITEQSVSGWKRGEATPSAEAFYRLGSLATRSEDTIWFWKQAGLDDEKLLAAARKVALETLKDPELFIQEGKVVLIPRYRETDKGREEAGPPVPLPAECIPNAASTICFVVDNQSLGVVDAPRGIFIVDTSIEGTENLRDLQNKVVLLYYKPHLPLSMPEGVYAGRLFFRSTVWKFGKTVKLVHDWNLHFLGSALIAEFLDIGSHSTELPFDLPDIWKSGIVPMAEFAALMKGSRKCQQVIEESSERMIDEFRMAQGNRIIGKVIGRLTGHLK